MAKHPPKSQIELPTSINPDLWREFLEHRRKLKAPMTPRAEALNARKLLTLSGGDPHIATAIIEQSIANGWRGVFPLNDRDQHAAMPSGKRYSPKTEQTISNLRDFANVGDGRR